MTSAIVDNLTEEELAERAAIEEKVESQKLTFIEVGTALSSIHRRKLYRNTHRTFKEYMSDRWSRSRAAGYFLMNAVETAEALSNCSVQPENEAQVRPLSKFKSFPELQEQAWEQTVNDADKVTAKAVEQTVKSYGQPLSLFPYFDEKQQLYSFISSLIKEYEFTQYCEPFFNNGSLYFKLRNEEVLTKKHKCILNDEHGEIADFLSVIRQEKTDFELGVKQKAIGENLTVSQSCQKAINFLLRQLENFLESHGEPEEIEKRLRKYLDFIPKIIDLTKTAICDKKSFEKCIEYYFGDTLFIVDLQTNSEAVINPLSQMQSGGVIAYYKGVIDCPDGWNNYQISGYTVLVKSPPFVEEESAVVDNQEPATKQEEYANVDNETAIYLETTSAIVDITPSWENSTIVDPRFEHFCNNISSWKTEELRTALSLINQLIQQAL